MESYFVDPDAPDQPVNLFFLEKLLAGRIRIVPGIEGRTVYLDLYYPAPNLAKVHEIFRFGQSFGNWPKVYIFTKNGVRTLGILFEFGLDWIRAKSLIPQPKRGRTANLPERDVSIHFYCEGKLFGSMGKFEEIFAEKEYFILTFMEQRMPTTMIVVGHYEPGPPPSLEYDWMRRD